MSENHHQHIIKDEWIELKRSFKKNYPKKLGRVVVWDEENQVIELITNQFNWSANTIGEL